MRIRPGGRRALSTTSRGRSSRSRFLRPPTPTESHGPVDPEGVYADHRQCRTALSRMAMRRRHDKPVYVGQPWRVVLRDVGLDAEAVLERAGQPANLFDGDGSWITV